MKNKNNTTQPIQPKILSLDNPNRPENNGIRATPQFEEDLHFELPPRVDFNNSHSLFLGYISDSE